MLRRSDVVYADFDSGDLGFYGRLWLCVFTWLVRVRPKQIRDGKLEFPIKTSKESWEEKDGKATPA